MRSSRPASNWQGDGCTAQSGADSLDECSPPIMLPSMGAHSLQDSTASCVGPMGQVFAPCCPGDELKRLKG